MDSFSYVNMFATKGSEYLLTIFWFLLLIPFWIIMSRQVKVSRSIESALGNLSRSLLRIPRGVFVTKQHTWTFLNSRGLAKIGIDDLLQHLTGDVSIRWLKDVGETVKSGEAIAELRKGNKQLSIKSPVSGIIRQANPRLYEDPGLLNTDPYAKGWLYALDPSDWSGETSGYFLADSAEDYLKKELDHVRDFIAQSLAAHSPEHAPTVLQDGGEIRDHALSTMPEPVWKDFQKEFLD